MTPMSFEVKRVHWGMTWFGIRDFWRAAEAHGEPILLDMTPARFDVLFLMLQRRLEAGARTAVMSQAEITRELGLSRSTISKMITKLELLGFVRRLDLNEGGRVRFVEMTRLGARALDAAVECVFGERRLDRWVRAYAKPMVSPRVEKRRRSTVTAWLSRLVERVAEVAHHFGYAAERPYWYVAEAEH